MSPGAPGRYLSCSVLNGFVYIAHIQGADGTLHLSYWTRDDAHKMLEPQKGDRLIHSVADLDAALQLSLTQPLRMVFVAEGLEEEARLRTRRPASRPPA